ncbi:hypothetical protein [Bifidobacterium sp.]|jgi:hypothetical protein|uniref:hypothetical protein n=1 Tax=Bifidobacterium sp. TaxID=41200 RepID=UPI0025BA9364|nr:hypothetical protein [Bifidobacterium sp.]MCH4209797.1 hypothetical protein [Bifidobacterium sp.]MCI1224588.1 hypothetical protein [Bifidobacterium sp.]
MDDIANLLAHDGNWGITIKGSAGSGEPVGRIERKPIGHYVIDPIQAGPELADQYGEALKNAKEPHSFLNVSHDHSGYSLFPLRTDWDAALGSQVKF